MAIKKQKKGGFEYSRTKKQIREYMMVPALRKLQWLEEMRRFNLLLAKAQPEIAKIQMKFRSGKN